MSILDTLQQELNELPKIGTDEQWAEFVRQKIRSWKREFVSNRLHDVLSNEFGKIEKEREPVDEMIISPFATSVFREFDMLDPHSMEAMQEVRKTGILGKFWQALLKVDDKMSRTEIKLVGRKGTVRIVNIAEFMQ